MNRKSSRAVPDWSRKILAFRRALKLTQDELGKRLKTSAVAVSRWERGDSEHALGISRKTRSVGFFGSTLVSALRT
jgi:transcriptional regulator with XRE-family HTH domain